MTGTAQIIKIIVVIVVIGSLGGAYVVITRTSDEVAPQVADKSNIVQPESSTAVVYKDGSPLEVFTSFKKEMEKTSNFDDVIAVFEVYTTEKKRQEIEASLATLRRHPAGEEAMYFLFMSANPTIESIDVLNESISENSAKLELGTNTINETGTVDFVKENGQWKIIQESWSIKITQ